LQVFVLVARATPEKVCRSFMVELQAR